MALAAVPSVDWGRLCKLFFEGGKFVVELGEDHEDEADGDEKRKQDDRCYEPCG